MNISMANMKSMKLLGYDMWGNSGAPFKIDGPANVKVIKGEAPTQPEQQ